MPEDETKVTHDDILTEIRALANSIKPMVEEWPALKEVLQARMAVQTGGKFLIWAGKVLIAAAVLIMGFKAGLSGIISIGGKP